VAGRYKAIIEKFVVTFPKSIEWSSGTLVAGRYKAIRGKFVVYVFDEHRNGPAERWWLAAIRPS
jgi:hypothetical protein